MDTFDAYKLLCRSARTNKEEEEGHFEYYNDRSATLKAQIEYQQTHLSLKDDLIEHVYEQCSGEV